MKNKRENGKRFIAALVFSFLSFSFAAQAQFTSDSDISVTVTPEIPGALVNTTITLSSFATDLNIATISWSANGQTVLSGIGKKIYTFKTGPIGSTTTIEATIAIPGIPLIVKKIAISPLEADLLWEAVDSYVPPFYKGKALPSSEALIKVVALPNIRTTDGVKLKPGDFTYNWTHNYNSEAAQSGYGKNYFTFRHSYLNDEEKVDMSLATIKGGYQAGNSVTLAIGAPKILFYENDPQLGVRYAKAIGSGGNFSVGPRGISIDAEPYFFSPKNILSSDLDFDWTINNQEVTRPAIKNILSVRPESDGLAKIDLSVASRSKIFQSGKKSLILNLTND